MNMRFLAEQGLRMGGRELELRVTDGICHITQLEIERFDGDHPIFLVKHTSFIENSFKRQDLVAYSESRHYDLRDAHAEFERVHFDPPTSVPENFG